MLINKLDDAEVSGWAWRAMLDSGLVERPDIRSRVEYMAKNAPDPTTREYRQRQLDHYDNVVALAGKYRQTFSSSNGGSDREAADEDEFKK